MNTQDPRPPKGRAYIIPAGDLGFLMLAAFTLGFTAATLISALVRTL